MTTSDITTSALQMVERRNGILAAAATILHDDNKTPEEAIMALKGIISDSWIGMNPAEWEASSLLDSLRKLYGWKDRGLSSLSLRPPAPL